MIEFGIKDFIDIFLVAVLLYYTYKLMKESGSLKLFLGVLGFFIVWVLVSQILGMKLLGSIFDKLISVGVLALIILFQEEIRHFFFTLGTRHKPKDKLSQFLMFWKKDARNDQIDLLPLVMACQNMSRSKTGALIVLQRAEPLHEIKRTGDAIDANLNQRLIENIFFKNSPLHDGAMIISKGRITAAGCILPVSHNLNIPKELGLRHRAALGMSQESDAIIIIVSEETGAISMAKNGEFKLRLSAEELEVTLNTEMEGY